MSLEIYECSVCERVMGHMPRDGLHVGQGGYCPGAMVPVRVLREGDVWPMWVLFNDILGLSGSPAVQEVLANFPVPPEWLPL